MKTISVILVCSLALLTACGPAKSTNMPQNASAQATATFSNKLATADELVVKITGLTALSGKQTYQGWLVGTDGKTVINVGTITPAADGSVTLNWASPTSTSLLAHYAGFQITQEDSDSVTVPSKRLVAAGTISDAAKALFAPGSTSPSPPAIGLIGQAKVAMEHSGMAFSAQQISAFDEMKAHVEHVINTLEGEKGKLYGDYLKTGVPQNPGDGYGVRAYETDVLALLKADGVSADTLKSLGDGFDAGIKEVEDSCLSVYKIKDTAQYAARIQQIKQQIADFVNGPIQQFDAACETFLSFPVKFNA